MKIEAGKKYVNHLGKIEGPLQAFDGSLGYAWRDDEGSTWSATGKYDINDHLSEPNIGRDLVAKYVEPVTIEFAQSHTPVDVRMIAEQAQDFARSPIGIAAADATTEVLRAKTLWPSTFNSTHEGYAVLLEEVDELKAHVWTNQKKRDLSAMRKEAIQVAAMALRFAAEVCDEERGRK